MTQIWRVYQRGLEQWLADLLQPTFDGLVEARSVPAFVKRLKIVEFTVDHAAPYFTNMRRRTSRKVALLPCDLRCQCDDRHPALWDTVNPSHALQQPWVRLASLAAAERTSRLITGLLARICLLNGK